MYQILSEVDILKYHFWSCTHNYSLKLFKCYKVLLVTLQQEYCV